MAIGNYGSKTVSASAVGGTPNSGVLDRLMFWVFAVTPTKVKPLKFYC